MMFRCRWALAAWILVSISGLAYADGDVPDDNAIQIHGFVSQGGLLTTDNNYLAHTEHGSLEFTEAGLNFTKQIDDRLSVGAQLFTRDLGPQGNYSAKFDWLQIDYRWKDWLGFRAGRVKVPFGFYNDTADIDAAQPVVLLPQSVYPETDRNFLLAQTGVEVYGYRPLGAAGALDYRAYTGSLFLTLDDSPDVHFSSVSVPWLVGGRVMWETPIEGLRAGFSALSGEIDANYTLLAMPQVSGLTVLLDESNYLGSVEYATDGFLFQAEYLWEHVHETTAYLDMQTAEAWVRAEGMYGLASYHVRPWLQTTLYYALVYPNLREKSGADHHQHDAAASVRFDINPHWILKLEAHYLRGTAVVDSALNVGVAREDLANQWGLFAAKTTVYF
jgi:hypothetical protein